MERLMEWLSIFLERLQAWLSVAIERLDTWIAGTLESLPPWASEAATWIAFMDRELRLAVFAGLGLLIAVLLVSAFLRRRRGDQPVTRLSYRTRWPRRIGYATILLFFGGFGLWSAWAPLASAALAPGVVSPDGSRKTVQHLEGGIIQAIHVREGDQVATGEPLVTLEDIQARAALEEVRERWVHLLANEARLVAEQSDLEVIRFPERLLDEGAKAADAMTAQMDLFDSRRETMAGRERILERRIAQLEEQIAGLERVIEAQDRQLDLIGQEIATVEGLLDQGLERMPRLLALQREEAEVLASKANNEATIARNRQQIGETEYEWLTLQAQDREEVNTELTQVRAELATVRSQLPSRQDMLARTTVTAPINGTVMNVQVTTESGVIGPGEPVLEIVPRESALIIDARVNPVDIDTVRPGQEARVLLTAFGQRNLPQIFGTLRSISPDRLVDERTGEAYFLAKVEVDPDSLTVVEPELELSAGMPADVMILTGERTVLDYLVRPLVESLTKTFRET